MTTFILGAAQAALLIAGGFYFGWKLRDSVGVAKGEEPVTIERRGGSKVLDGWDIPEEG